MLNVVTNESPTCKTCASRSVSAICKIEEEFVPNLESEKQSFLVKKGQPIFEERIKPQGLFCLNSGKVKLVKIGEDGKEQILRLIKPGDLLGYRALLTSDRYSATAVALEECSVCFLPKSMFMTLLKKDSNLNLELIKILGDDLKKAEEQITHLAQKPVRERMAEALLFIKETYGYETDGATINVKLTREELSNLVGTATETVIRLLSEFNHHHVVELVGKKIKILNLPQLIHIANLKE